MLNLKIKLKMKKILITLLLTPLLSFGGINTMLSDISAVSDTVTNTGTAYVQLEVEGVYQQVSIQAIVTKISGTVAGTVILYASIDGTNFNAIGTDTLTNTDVTTNTKVWVTSNTPYKYYRITATGSGTMAAQLTGKVWLTPSSGLKHSVYEMLDAAGAVDDTIANTATGYVGYTVNNYYETVAIQAVVTKLSGTAAGTVTLQGSLDGTNYVTVSSSFATATTLTVTNVTTNSKLFVVTGSPYRYYRLSYTGSGTMSCKLNGYLLPSKDNGR